MGERLKRSQLQSVENETHRAALLTSMLQMLNLTVRLLLFDLTS